MERFYGRSVRTYQPELVKKKINHQQLIAARAEMQKKMAAKLGRRSKDDFKEGDQVVCQDMTTKRWTIKGEIVEGREAEDGSVRSFIIKTESGRTTIQKLQTHQIPGSKQSVIFRGFCCVMMIQQRLAWKQTQASLEEQVLDLQL